MPLRSRRNAWISASVVVVACSVLDVVTRSPLVSWIFLVLTGGGAVLIAVHPSARKGAAPQPAQALGAATAQPAGSLLAADEYAPPLRALWREALLLGLTGFGGGLAVLSSIERRFVARRHWIRERTFLEACALGQSLPGAVAANTLAMIGLRLRGVLGAVVAVGGFVLPSFLILLAFALIYGAVRQVAAVDGLFRGLHPAVAGLVAATAIRLGGRVALNPDGTPGGWRVLVRDRWSLGVLVASGWLVAFVHIGVVETLLLSGLVGLLRGTVLARFDPLGLVEAQWRWLRRRAWDVSHDPGKRGWRRWFGERPDDLLALAPLSLNLGGPAFPGAWHALGDLCGVFLRAGATTFGGGFVMIPLLEHELVAARGWLTPQAFADAMALGQVTPGPVVITATFVGYTLSGLVGAILATIAVFLPAFLMVIVVAGSVQRFRRMSGVQAFLQGIQPAVVGLMFAAAVTMLESGGINPANVTIAVVAFAVLALARVNSAWVLLGGALAGVASRALGL